MTDAAGGPKLERVTKLCRDARGFDRLRGCGKRFDGWVIAAGPLPRKVIGMLPPKFRQQLTEPDGAIWGLCDSCLRKIEALRTPVVAVQPVVVRRPARVGEGF